jgi:acetyl esterase/lipase
MEPKRDLHGVVGMAGPYDFLPIREKYWGIVGREPGWPATQPIRFVEGDEPPMLLLTGDNDNTVDPGNVRRLAARIRETGGEVATRTYANLNHIFLVGVLAAPFRPASPVRDDIVAWMRGHEPPGATAASVIPRR